MSATTNSPADLLHIELGIEPDKARRIVEIFREAEWGPVASIEERLSNELAFNEGYQEHIGDLLDAMKPFVRLVDETSGRIPTERLSFKDWHNISKAFNSAVTALGISKAAEQEKR